MREAAEGQANLRGRAKETHKRGCGDGARLKFYGWGQRARASTRPTYERVSRFVAEKLGAEPRAASRRKRPRSRCARRASLRPPLSRTCSRRIRTNGCCTLTANPTPKRCAPLLAISPTRRTMSLLPETEADIAAVFDWASGAKIAVVPFGAGSSVVGGVEPIVGDGYAGAVSLDMRRLNRVLDVDVTSRAARIQAGILGPAIEAALKPHGFALRHYPQSFEFLDARRLDRHPLGRPLRHALHTYRRSRRKPAHDHTGGRHESRADFQARAQAPVRTA